LPEVFSSVPPKDRKLNKKRRPPQPKRFCVQAIPEKLRLCRAMPGIGMARPPLPALSKNSSAAELPCDAGELIFFEQYSNFPFWIKRGHVGAISIGVLLFFESPCSKRGLKRNRCVFNIKYNCEHRIRLLYSHKKMNPINKIILKALLRKSF